MDNDLVQTSSPSRLTKLSRRRRLEIALNSTIFMIGIIVLVIIDSCLVICELLFEVVTDKVKKDYIITHMIIRIISITILSIFFIEIVARIYVLGFAFLKNVMELFDSVVVVVSLVLDTMFSNTDGSIGAGLLIMLRLWRVTRIVNGVIMSAKRKTEKAIQNERKGFVATQQELELYQILCTAQELEIARLNKLLRENHIKFITGDLSMYTNVIPFDETLETKIMIEENFESEPTSEV